MTRKNTLNNLIMGNVRKTHEYQTVITDLAIEGVLPLATAEKLLGYEIPEYLHAPDGKHVERAKIEPAARKARARDSAAREEEKP